jgi:hypothetical protein
MSPELDNTSVSHLLSLCHSYTDEGFIVDEKTMIFKVVGESLYMHSSNVDSASDYKEFSCEVFNVRNQVTNHLIGNMVHYTNKDIFRCFFVKGYIGYVVKYFIMFQKDMDNGLDRAKSKVIFED